MCHTQTGGSCSTAKRESNALGHSRSLNNTELGSNCPMRSHTPCRAPVPRAPRAGRNNAEQEPDGGRRGLPRSPQKETFQAGRGVDRTRVRVDQTVRQTDGPPAGRRDTCQPRRALSCSCKTHHLKPGRIPGLCTHRTFTQYTDVARLRCPRDKPGRDWGSRQGHQRACGFPVLRTPNASQRVAFQLLCCTRVGPTRTRGEVGSAHTPSTRMQGAGGSRFLLLCHKSWSPLGSHITNVSPTRRQKCRTTQTRLTSGGQGHGEPPRRQEVREGLGGNWVDGIGTAYLGCTGPPSLTHVSLLLGSRTLT